MSISTHEQELETKAVSFLIHSVGFPKHLGSLIPTKLILNTQKMTLIQVTRHTDNPKLASILTVLVCVCFTESHRCSVSASLAESS